METGKRALGETCDVGNGMGEILETGILRGGTFRTWILSPLLRKGCGETGNGCWCWQFSVTRGLFSQLVGTSSWVREDFLLRLSGL